MPHHTMILRCARSHDEQHVRPESCTRVHGVIAIELESTDGLSVLRSRSTLRHSNADHLYHQFPRFWVYPWRLPQEICAIPSTMMQDAISRSIDCVHAFALTSCWAVSVTSQRLGQLSVNAWIPHKLFAT